LLQKAKLPVKAGILAKAPDTAVGSSGLQEGKSMLLRGNEICNASLHVALCVFVKVFISVK